MSNTIRTEIPIHTETSEEFYSCQNTIESNYCNGDKLLLKPETDPTWNDSGVSVWHEKTNQKLGFINRRITPHLLKFIQSDGEAVAVITDTELNLVPPNPKGYGGLAGKVYITIMCEGVNVGRTLDDDFVKQSHKGCLLFVTLVIVIFVIALTL